MKKHNTGALTPSSKETEFRKSPIAIACALALFAGAAVAQQTPEPAKTEAAKKDDAKAAADAKKKKEDAQKVDTVVVTGIRRGIEDAISLKQGSNSIVEAISAEDIGKLPDNSIAESIARLPGLAAQRVAGRAQTISIRGLSGDFAGTILNGREQVSTGDNRAVEFDQYPSELLSAVVIYKTPDATLIGQGLSGTVDLQTVRPLSFGKRAVAVNLRGEKNSLGKVNGDTKDRGSRFSVSYIDQSADKKLGWALGYARLESPSQVQRWEAWGYPDSQGKPGVPNGTLLLGGSKQFGDSTKATRDGFMGVLEYKPNANFSSLLDVYYSKFDQKTVLRGYEAGLEWGGGTLSNPTVSGGLVTAGTWASIKPVLRNDQNKRDDDITALGWNNKFNMGNGWTAVGDLSYSKANRDESILETYAGTIGTRDTVRFTTDNNGRPVFSYGLNYADPNIIKLLDSGGWGQDGYIKFPKVTDELKSMRLTAKKDLDGFFSGMEFGLNLSQREKTRFVDEYFLTLKTPNTTVPSGLLIAPTSLSFVGVPGVLSYDVQGALNTLYNLRSNINNRDIINKDWQVEEKVNTAFAKFEIDSEWGGVPVRGNVGIQAVHTDQSSSASAVSNSGPAFLRVRYTDGTTYTDYLPSLNLAFSFPYEQTIRLGIAKTLARARLDQLRASNNFSIDVTKRLYSGDGGNPRLEPFRANAIDVSYEKYFGNRAYIGVAGFYKNLLNFIYQDKIAKDFTGYPNNTTVTVLSNIGEFSTPINGSGGNIKGFEFSASLPLNLMMPQLDGFGVVASHSDTKSGIKPNGPNGGTQPLPGLSRRVTNLTAYFEKYGFSARVSQRERSDFVGEVTGFGADREFRYIKGEKVVDFQLGYAFESGSLKGLSILFQVNNANNEPYRTYDGVPIKPNQYTVYGRTTLLGVNYKF
jgi:iron complex outermembrane receptor protein